VKCHQPDGTVFETSVFGTLAGRRFTEVTLTLKDFYDLYDAKPEHLREWAGHLATRFGPEEQP
jgi:hypothetical protein